jgi:hypothetical protein
LLLRTTRKLRVGTIVIWPVVFATFLATYERSHIIASNCRQFKTLLVVAVQKSNQACRTAAMAFQSRLFDALSDLETNGLAHIASWQPHGCCFQIHKPNLFTKLVLPRYVGAESAKKRCISLTLGGVQAGANVVYGSQRWFGQTKWSSFERQLTIFGFARIDFGEYQPRSRNSALSDKHHLNFVVGYCPGP